MAKTAANVDSFPDCDTFTEAMRAAVIGCNGFAYPGSDLEAQIRLIKYLRTHPAEASVLLDPALADTRPGKD